MGLLRNAGVCTGAMLVGVAAGVMLVCVRLARVERLGDAAYAGASGVDQLDPLLREFGGAGAAISTYRFPVHAVFDPGGWAVTAIFIFVAAMAGLVAARRAPTWLAAAGFCSAPPAVRSEARAAWRGFLGREAARGPSALFLAMVMALGFAGMIVAEAHAIVQVGASASGTPARPVLGVCAWSDAVWLLGAAVAAPAGMVIRRARGAIRTDPGTRSRWCYACGYPRLVSGEELSEVRPCSECGSTWAPAAVSGPDRRARSVQRWAVVAAFFVVALGVHAAVPWVPGVVGRVAGGDAVLAHDAAVVPSGAVVLVERPRERIWLQVSGADGGQGGSAAGWLHGRLEPAAGTGGAGVSWSMPLADGIIGPELIDAGEGSVIRLTVEWQSESGLAYVYLVPAGAVSIRAVEPGSAPPLGEGR